MAQVPTTESQPRLLFDLEDAVRNVVRCGSAQHPDRWAAEAARAVMGHLSGETDAELATALGVSERTARRRRALLRSALREAEGG
jgi:hypothetical protein